MMPDDTDYDLDALAKWIESHLSTTGTFGEHLERTAWVRARLGEAMAWYGIMRDRIDELCNLLAETNCKWNTPAKANDENDGRESACRPGGDYGLCRTHSTCEMVQRMLKAADARADRAEASAEKMREAIESVLSMDGMVSVGGWNRLNAALADSAGQVLLDRLAKAEASAGKMKASIENLLNRSVARDAAGELKHDFPLPDP